MRMENLRTARSGVRALMWISNLNCRNDLDDLSLLGHYSSLKSEDYFRMNMTHFQNFLIILKNFNFFSKFHFVCLFFDKMS